MWAEMRMMPTDILDVTGSTYTYLANGHGPEEGLEYLFSRGQRVRISSPPSRQFVTVGTQAPGSWISDPKTGILKRIG